MFDKTLRGADASLLPLLPAIQKLVNFVPAFIRDIRQPNPDTPLRVHIDASTVWCVNTSL